MLEILEVDNNRLVLLPDDLGNLKSKPFRSQIYKSLCRLRWLHRFETIGYFQQFAESATGLYRAAVFVKIFERTV